jgi:hypothetical protein
VITGNSRARAARPTRGRRSPPSRSEQAGGETYGGVDVEGNTRAELVERAKQAGIRGYSRMNKAELGRQLQRKEHD